MAAVIAASRNLVAMSAQLMAFLLTGMRSGPLGRDAGDMGLTCLIVDDNDRFLEVARELLEQEGISVVGVASRSADALSKAVELQPDVVLVDICLGEESGLDLARQLVEDRYAVPSGVILISTYAEDDYADMLAKSPASFLPKAALSGRTIREIVQGTA